jgi:hypothetical protein
MYYVLGDGGAKFGPADVTTLKQWVIEGRVLPTTMLEDAVTGTVTAASAINDLYPGGQGAPGPMDMPPSTSTPPPGMAPGPVAEPANPYGTPTGGQIGTGYQAPPGSSSPYVRPGGGSTPDTSGSTMNTLSIVFGAISLVTCCCSIFGGVVGLGLAVASFITGSKAKTFGYNPTLAYVLAGIGAFFNLTVIVLVIVGVAVNPQALQGMR